LPCLRALLDGFDPFLFLQFFILAHLLSYAFLILSEENKSGLIFQFFFFLSSSLFLDYLQEILTFLLSMLFQTFFAFSKLLNTSHFEAFQKSLSFFTCCLFSCT
jgi:hypothetical protein